MSDSKAKYNRKREYSMRVIRDAFLELLHVKSLEKITVTEICEKADINRSTFYANYLDIYDLSEKIQDEWYQEITALVADYEFLDEMDFYTRQFSFYQNSPLKEVLMFLPNDRIIDRLTQDMYAKVVGPRITESKDPLFLNYAYRYSVGGSNALIKQWIKEGMKTPPETIAEYMYKLNTAVIGLASHEGVFKKALKTKSITELSPDSISKLNT